MMRSGRRTASALSGSKGSVRNEDGDAKQQRSRQIDEWPTDENDHVAYPSASSAPITPEINRRDPAHSTWQAWPGRWPHDEAAGALKTRDKRCSRSSFGTRMAKTWWRKLCPIHQSISAIRTRKSSKARG